MTQLSEQAEFSKITNVSSISILHGCTPPADA